MSEIKDAVEKLIKNASDNHFSISPKDVVEQLLQFEHEALFGSICDYMRNPYLDRTEWIICTTTLCRIDKQRANQVFIEALKSHDAEKRYRLLKLLWGCATEIILPSINKLLKEDTDPSIRYVAAMILGDIGNSSSIEALEWSLKHDTGVNYEDSAIADAAKFSLMKIKNKNP